MSKTITSRVLRPHMHTDGKVAQRGDQVTNDEARHKALAAKGYVASEAEAAPAASAGKAPRAGLTNADFKPRRAPLVGGAEGDETATTRKGLVRKGGKAKGK